MCGPYVSRSASNSLYECVNVKIAEARIPGITSGSTTWKKRRTGPAPQTLAASSTRSSSPSKVAASTMMA